MKIAFVGLGAMGGPMARNLAAAGHQVLAFNRTRARAEALAGHGVEAPATLTDAVCEAEVVVTMLADDAAVEDIVFGKPADGGQLTEGVLGAMPSGAVHVSMSTLSPSLALRLAQAHQAAGQGFVASPVFGRPEAAAAGRLWLVVAGAGADVDRCLPMFDALSAGRTVVGEQPWMASLVKLAGNFVLAAMIETLGEVFALARKSGVSAEPVLDVLTRGLPWGAIVEGYAQAVAAQRFEPAGFKLSLGLKDMRLALEAADRAGVPMPLLSLLRDHLLESASRGWGDRDWSAVSVLARERAGLGG
jgi:3-hydroxyisobutyrate dehydrogenase-like beta-hydroxyacid dehydrogenase